MTENINIFNIVQIGPTAEFPTLKKTDSVGNLGILPFQNTGIFFFFFNYTDTKALDHET